MSDGASGRAGAGSLRPFYADWAGYNRRTIEGLRRLTEAELALRAPTDRGSGEEHWPIWAIAAHTAGARTYWLCHVFGEPGVEATPFQDPSGYGWEDDLDHVRSADEVAGAWESTWLVVEGCLDSWTVDTLGHVTHRRRPDRPDEVHTRQSILLRMINHEAYHLGEINIALGANGCETIDPWPGHDWEEGSPPSLREG